MKIKWWIFLVFSILLTLQLNADSWAFEGNDLSGHFLGDHFSIYYIMNADAWLCTSKDIGLGQTDSDGGLSWTGVTWDNEGGDGFGNNEGVRIDVQVTATGTWYYSLRCDGNYKGTGDWTAMSGSYESGSFSVSALNNPTFTSAVKNSTYSSTDIDLTLSEDAEGHNVLIVVREGSAVDWTPTNNVTYNDNEDIGTNHTVVKGSYDPSVSGTTVTDNFLKPGTAYYYKVFSENWHYYSSGVTQTSVTTDALPKPTGVSATMLSDSKIKVDWTPNGTYGNVMLVARKSSDLSADPTNGTEYSVTDALGGWNSHLYRDSIKLYLYQSGC
ncbi:MAG: hypothetical protein K9N06_10000 [Candidatus Cloacimonetes bacterium]|nr:hypothetical protein [Candidatus Cloacimonadota bacterium]